MRNTEILWTSPSLETESYLIIGPLPLPARGSVPNFPVEWSLVASSDYRSKRVHRPISSNESGGGRGARSLVPTSRQFYTRYQTEEWKMYANLTVLGALKNSMHSWMGGGREERFLRGSLCLYLKGDIETFSRWFGETKNWKLRTIISRKGWLFDFFKFVGLIGRDFKRWF